MSNMSYCRFQNTASDFADCLEHLRTLNPNDDGFNARKERRGRARLIEMAAELLCELGIEDPSDNCAIQSAIDDLDHAPIDDADED